MDIYCGSLQETLIFCFLLFFDGRLRKSPSSSFWRIRFVAYFVKISPESPFRAPLILPLLALKSGPICTGASLSAISLFQAHSHSLALISNCFFIFVCTFKDRELGGEWKGESKGLCERREQMASPSPPLCTQAPVLANSTQCLSTEPFVVQKEGPACSYRQGRTCEGKAWRSLATGESQGRERGLVPSSLGMTRHSHLCLLLLGQEKVGVEISIWLCTDAISSLGGKSTALKAAESP